MKTTNRLFIVMLLAASQMVFANDLDEPSSFIVPSSLKISEKNPQLLEFQYGFNLSVGTPTGKSVARTHFVHCQDQVMIIDSWATVYAKANGTGKVLGRFPLESEREDLKNTSPMSMIAAAICEKFNRPLGNNPNALIERRRQWDKLGEELRNATKQ